MAQSIQQTIRANAAGLKELWEFFRDLERRVKKLEFDYDQPADAVGRRLPPTPRPERLIELNVGVDPVPPENGG